jgi:nicotinamide-nucleotide amidase
MGHSHGQAAVIFAPALMNPAKALLDLCRDRRLKIATAESCTGGLLAALLTEIPGSSHVFERGFVTYSNEAQSELLGVSDVLLARHGAVSQEVAHAMAVGCLDRSNVDLSVSVTGVAGPGGGSAQKPVGLVYLACLRRGHAPVPAKLMLGDRSRQEIREAGVIEALRLLKSQAAR